MLVITLTVHARWLLSDLRRWLQALIVRPVPAPVPVRVERDPRR